MLLRPSRGLSHSLTLLLPALGLAALVAGSPALAEAKPNAKPKQESKEDKAFKKRLAELKKDASSQIVVKMLPTDDPEKLPKLAGGLELGMGPVLVAGNREGLYVPETLSPGDILRVINKNIVDVRKCYKKQLATDPEWNDELILDLSIKKSGRVSEVSISPRRVRRDVIGECMMSTVPKWKFPQFSGESDEGVTQEVVNASFPFSLTPQPAE